MIDILKAGRILRKLLIVSILSAFVFGAVSFISILVQLHPISERLLPELTIGYPFTFYREFYLGGGQVNFSWNAKYLVTDIGIIWGVVFLVFEMYNQMHKRRTYRG